LCQALQCSTLSFLPDPLHTELYTLSLHDALPILIQYLYKATGGCSMKQDNRDVTEIGKSKKDKGNKPKGGTLSVFRVVSVVVVRSEEHTSELQSRFDLVCRLLLEKKNTICQPSEQ